MPLNLYRRHYEQKGRCAGGHKPDSQTYESDELRPKWRKCGCPIYASGKLGDNPKFRKNTGRHTYPEARLVAEAWEKGVTPPPPTPPPVAEKPAQRALVEDGVTQYLANRKTRGPAAATMGKYAAFTRRLMRFLDSKGVDFFDQVDIALIDDFYNSWTLAPGPKGKELERMKSFFRFCNKRKLIAEHPCEDLEPPIGYSIVHPKTPLNDEELDRIFDAADRWDRLLWRQWGWKDGGGNPGKVTRDQVVCFLLVLVETGLRISDCCTFNVSERLNYETGECYLMMHKTGKPLFTWLNPDLVARLRALVDEFGPVPFDTPSQRIEQKTDTWRKRLDKVFEAAGPFAVRPTPHILRHTFARLQLQRGVSVDDVAELVGDTAEMVSKHYSRWVPERQARLTNILREAYAQSQKSKWRKRVVAMPKVG